MKRIWKFETPIEGKFKIKMPIGAKVLCIQVDQKTQTPCIWALVNDDSDLEFRYFELYGTGHNIDIEKDILYIGTYQLQNGSFVGHLFENTLI